jgi:hypothetical protein
MPSRHLHSRAIFHGVHWKPLGNAHSSRPAHLHDFDVVILYLLPSLIMDMHAIDQSEQSPNTPLGLAAQQQRQS